MRTIDLNADLGEGCGNDAALMPWITSCNVACGGHAGDAETMAAAFSLAKKHSVVAGAHPSYPDREGFGRRMLNIAPGVLAASLAHQVSEAEKVANQIGMPLQHIKAHGALYNAAAVDAELADLFVSAVSEGGRQRRIVGLPSSELQRAAARHDLPFVAEGFLDRRYLANGSLQPRTEPGAMLESQTERQAQALALACGEPVLAVGGELMITVQTICLHGDSEHAADTARLTRTALERRGVDVKAPYG